MASSLNFFMKTVLLWGEPDQVICSGFCLTQTLIGWGGKQDKLQPCDQAQTPPPPPEQTQPGRQPLCEQNQRNQFSDTTEAESRGCASCLADGSRRVELMVLEGSSSTKNHQNHQNNQLQAHLSSRSSRFCCSGRDSHSDHRRTCRRTRRDPFCWKLVSVRKENTDSCRTNMGQSYIY